MTIEGEYKEQSIAVPVGAVEQSAIALAPVSEMSALFEKGAEQATVIADLLRKQKLITNIGGREHIRFEGWVPIATANGKRLDVIEVSTEGNRGGDDFTAIACVGLRDLRSNEVVARAWATCSRRERNWKSRDDYAIESMAQTRAGGKVCRLVYGWIIALAGFEATPDEEMPQPPHGWNTGQPQAEPEKPANLATPQKAAPKDTSGPMTAEARDAVETARAQANAVGITAAQIRLKGWGFKNWMAFFNEGTVLQAQEIERVLSGEAVTA